MDPICIEDAWNWFRMEFNDPDGFACLLSSSKKMASAND